jgi:hypothetical protein
MGASICWATAETDTQFTIFDSSALKKQCLIFLFDCERHDLQFTEALDKHLNLKAEFA